MFGWVGSALRLIVEAIGWARAAWMRHGERESGRQEAALSASSGEADQVRREVSARADEQRAIENIEARAERDRRTAREDPGALFRGD